MHQSHIEIEDYSVACFNHIVTIVSLNSDKGGVHVHFLDSLDTIIIVGNFQGRKLSLHETVTCACKHQMVRYVVTRKSIH